MNDMLPATNANLLPNSLPINEEGIRSIRKRIDANQPKLKRLDVNRKREEASHETMFDIRTDHVTLCQNIIGYYAFLGLFFGIVCRYDWNRYRHCVFWTTNFLLIMANFCIVYTAYIYYQRGDITKILEPLAMSGIAITSTLKWAVFLNHANPMLALMFAVRKICKETKSGDRVDAITAALHKTCSVLRVFAAALTGVLLFFVSVPLKFFLVDGIYYPLLPILIPFCGEDTLRDYLWTTFFQSILGFYSCISTLTFASVFLIIICNYGLLVNLIELDLKDLNEMWRPLSETPIAVKHAFMHNIAAKLQDTQRYIKEVKKIYETKFCVYFLASYVGQVICLYEITEKDWLPGYTVLFIVFIEMMFYCMVGTQTTTLGEKMCTFIEQTDWYTYDIHCQRTLRFMLQQCQQPCSISLKSLGTLNVVTGIGVVKGIYYYYTALTEVL